MKIYLAGPMTGIKDFNYPVFKLAAARLREMGHEVFNPAESDIPAEHPDARRLWFEEDTAYICKHAEAVALLPGWEQSKNAVAEGALAIALNLTLMVLGEDFAKETP